MKHILSFLIVLLFGFQSFAFQYTYEGKTLEYKVISEAEKKCEVTELFPRVTGSVSIPQMAYSGGVGYTVTSIGSDAFGYCRELSSVSIPASVTSIGLRAFYNCEELLSVSIPASVTSIGSNAFCLCSKLNSINLPASISSIGSHAFASTGLSSITVPSLVTSIEAGTFWGCSSLKTVKLPSNLTAIKEKAFYNCSILPSINIPSTVTSIETDAFQNCSKLTTINLPNSILTIGEGAFKNCSLLSFISFSNSLSAIAKNCFENCTSLSSIDIPNNITEIGESAFKDCSKLASINIPKSVIKIGGGAFNNCIGKLIFNIALDFIDTGAFYNYKGDVHLIFDESVSSLKNYAYGFLTALKEVYLPNSVTSIGDGAFQVCSNLETINLPNSLTSMGFAVFNKCNNLKVINSYIENPQKCNAGSQSFSQLNAEGYSINYKTITLTVPYGTAEKYRAMAPWNNFANIVERAPEGPLATFAVADVSMRMGDTQTLPVSMNNKVDIISFQCDIHLPAGFEVAKNAKGKPVVKLGARKADTHNISANVLTDGVVRVACFSIENGSFSGSEGELFTIDIQPVSATAGVHEVTIDNIVAAKTDVTGVNIDPVKCNINLRKALMPGDVNDDDAVNVSDAIATVGYILGNVSDNYLLENADLNGDGIINILDVSEIIKIVLGTSQTSQTPVVVKAPMLVEANNTEAEALYVENFEIKSGEEKLLPVKVRTNREYTGFQTDIYLPEGLEVVTTTKGNTTTPDVKLNEECNSGTHIISSAIQKDGALRVLSMSMENDMYAESADKTLFTVRVRVKSEFTSSVIVPVYFRKTLFDSGSVRSNFADSSSEIGINNTTTGIADIIDGENAKRYFNLQGMPVKNPVKGMIYIQKTASTTEKVVY